MSELTKQKVMGIFFIVMSILMLVLTKDGTIGLLLIPAGLFLIATKDIVIVQAQTSDDDCDEYDEYEGDEDDEDDE